MSEKRALIALRGVTKLYRKGQETVRALDGIDLVVAEKGMAAVVGASGSGKSSLRGGRGPWRRREGPLCRLRSATIHVEDAPPLWAAAQDLEMPLSLGST